MSILKLDGRQQTGRFPGMHTPFHNADILKAKLTHDRRGTTAATAASTNEHERSVAGEDQAIPE